MKSLFLALRQIRTRQARTLVLLVFLGLVAGFLNVSDTYGIVKRVGTAGFAFLEIPATARMAAMGDAYIAMGEITTAEGLFMNPATLGYVTGKSVSVSYGTWLADMNHQTAAFAVGLEKFGSVGVSFIRLDAGDLRGAVLDETTISGWRQTGTFNFGSWAIGPTYALRMTDRFSFGATMRYVRESASNVKEIGRGSDFSASNWIAEVGTLYYTGFGSLRFATNIQGVGFDSKFESDPFQAPVTYRIGAGYDFFDAPESPAVLTMVFEALHPTDSEEKINVGAELWLADLVALRGGYKFNYSEEDYTAGIGFRFDMGGGRPVGADFAYVNYGQLDTVTRFSLNIGF